MLVAVATQAGMTKQEGEADLLVTAAERACCSIKQFKRLSSPVVLYWHLVTRPRTGLAPRHLRLRGETSNLASTCLHSLSFDI